MSSGVEKRDIKHVKGLIDNVTVSVSNIICNTYSIRIAIWISRTAIYCDTVLVGDTHPLYGHGGHLGHATWIIYIYIGITPSYRCLT